LQRPDTINGPLRVALLRGDDYHNTHLDNVLRAEFNIVLTVVERGVDQRRALIKRGLYKDAIAAEYHRLRRKLLRLDAYRRKHFNNPVWAGKGDPGVMTTHSINADSVQQVLAAAHADICVITCTTKLSAQTIDNANCPIVNIHGGHLPDYRGCHCFFFALYEGQFDKIGSTIHIVNEGLDTGDIIEVVRPGIDPRDNAEKLYCKAEEKAASRIADILRRYEVGEAIESRPQPFRGRLILRRHRLPHHDVVFWIRRNMKSIRLPSVKDGERWSSAN
jgi:methionyl-tRNA formyltransferase